MTALDLEAAAARVIADGPVPLAKLAKRIPADRDGKLGHISTAALVRWIERGRNGVRLDGARLSGKGWCSSLQALARFSAALAAAEQGEAAVAPPCERERRAQAALAELDRLKKSG
jgi:hypothetical protein